MTAAAIMYKYTLYSYKMNIRRKIKSGRSAGKSRPAAGNDEFIGLAEKSVGGAGVLEQFNVDVKCLGAARGSGGTVDGESDGVARLLDEHDVLKL